MSEIGIEIVLLAILLLFNGLFSMSEIAIVSARRVRLAKMAESGNSGAKTAIELAENPDRFLSTVQIGITLVGILSGAFGGATISKTLAAWLNQFPALAGYSEAISFFLVVLVITYFSLIIGELLPKSIGLKYPELISVNFAKPMQFVSRLTSPVVWLLSASTTALLKILQIKQPANELVTEEEIKALIAQGTASGVIDETEQDLLESVIRLDEQNIKSLMTPRLKISWLNLAESNDIIKRKIIKSQHSRLPVGQGSVDNIVGYVKTRDLLTHLLQGNGFDLEVVLKQPLFVPETKTALELLEMFKTSETSFGVVVDEFGSTEGVVSLNDVMEAIVGDLPSGGILNQSAVQREDGSWLLDGRLSTTEFKDILGLKKLPANARTSYKTLAGFIIKRLQKVPKIGDRFDWEDWIFEVVDMDGKRVDEVLVSPKIKNHNSL
jgi:putative hemolysin